MAEKVENVSHWMLDGRTNRTQSILYDINKILCIQSLMLNANCLGSLIETVSNKRTCRSIHLSFRSYRKLRLIKVESRNERNGSLMVESIQCGTCGT